MKAVQIHQYGGPEVLKLEEIPRPDPAVGELLVRVKAAGVNPVDWKTRAGRGVSRLYGKERFPLTVGWDISGVVEAVGPEATCFEVGDEVFGDLSGGAGSAGLSGGGAGEGHAGPEQSDDRHAEPHADHADSVAAGGLSDECAAARDGCGPV